MKFLKKLIPLVLFLSTLHCSVDIGHAANAGSPDRTRHKLLDDEHSEGGVSTMPVFRPSTDSPRGWEVFHLTVDNLITMGNALSTRSSHQVSKGDQQTLSETFKLLRKTADVLVGPIIEPDYDIAWNQDENKIRSDSEAKRLGKERELEDHEIDRIIYNVKQIAKKQTVPGIPGITTDRKTRTLQGIYLLSDFRLSLGLIDAFYTAATGERENLRHLQLDVSVPTGKYDLKRSKRTVASPGTTAHTHFHIAASARDDIEVDLDAGRAAALEFIHQNVIEALKEPASTTFTEFRDLIGMDNLRAIRCGSILKPICIEEAKNNSSKIDTFVGQAEDVLRRAETKTAHLTKTNLNPSPIPVVKRTSLAASSSLPGGFPLTTPTLRLQIHTLKPLVLNVLRENASSLTETDHSLAHYMVTNAIMENGGDLDRAELIERLSVKPSLHEGFMEEEDLLILEALVTSLEAISLGK